MSNDPMPFATIEQTPDGKWRVVFFGACMVAGFSSEHAAGSLVLEVIVRTVTAPTARMAHMDKTIQDAMEAIIHRQEGGGPPK